MSAKEKAIELVETFWTEVEDNDYQTRKMSFKQAKQCALIAVDELINYSEEWDDSEYWQEVKHEINNL